MVMSDYGYLYEHSQLSLDSYERSQKSYDHAQHFMITHSRVCIEYDQSHGSYEHS